jgi:hypothetical protein
MLPKIDGHSEQLLLKAENGLVQLYSTDLKLI